MTNAPDVIERLRTMAAVETKRFTVEQVDALVASLAQAASLDEVKAATGFSSSETFDMVASLGTWLVHAYGPTDLDIVRYSEIEQPSLFGSHSDGQVVIPEGFERRGKQRREVSKALAAIVAHQPDTSVVSRFLDRLYPTRVSVLTARDVFAMYRFAQLGRLSELDQIADNPAFCQTLVSAYEVLDDAINNAEEALGRLADTDAAPEAVAEACIAARWLHEGTVGRIERLAKLAQSSGDPRGLRTAQRTLAREIGRGAWKIAEIEQLTEGQIQRICEAAGIADGLDRREEVEIRTRLTDLGLDRDLDMLVPEGISASRAGHADEFWQAIAARLEGDPQWRDVLEDAIAVA